jgi:hypothetical protein
MEESLEYLHSTSNDKEFLEMTDLLPFSDAIKACEIAENEIRKQATNAYRDLCSCYKIHRQYECGNYSHRQEWKTKVCDMNCRYMKIWFEKFTYKK